MVWYGTQRDEVRPNCRDHADDKAGQEWRCCLLKVSDIARACPTRSLLLLQHLFAKAHVWFNPDNQSVDQ